MELTLSLRASHVFFASPRSMLVLGLKNTGFATSAYLKKSTSEKGRKRGEEEGGREREGGEEVIEHTLCHPWSAS